MTLDELNKRIEFNKPVNKLKRTAQHIACLSVLMALPVAFAVPVIGLPYMIIVVGILSKIGYFDMKNLGLE